MRPFIIVCDGFDKLCFQNLCAEKEFEVHPQPKVSENELNELLPKANALVIRSATTVNEKLLKLAPNLKYVIRAGEGTDNIDKKLCESMGVKVSNTPGANNNSAAEHALALMFTVLRQTAMANQTMKNGKWEKSKFVGLEISGKNVGLIGHGRIGSMVSKKLSGMDTKTFFFDPHCKSYNKDHATQVNTIEELFKMADIISIHTPLNDSTRNLVNKNLFSIMKKGGILINAARGGIVNETDLYEALTNGTLFGAGLDVFENEPLEANSKLRELENLVLTPHIGASTKEAQDRVGEMAVHQLKEFFIQSNLLNEVKA